MKLVALPGRNSETEAWMLKLTDRLRLGQTATVIAHYQHWDNTGEPDVLAEVDRIEVASDDLVIAKSLGTLVLLAYASRHDALSGAVFIGTPLRGYPESTRTFLRQLLEETPILFIQQTADFSGSFAELNSLVGDVRQATMAEIAGEDHVYSDTEELAEIISGWWLSWEDPASGNFRCG